MKSEIDAAFDAALEERAAYHEVTVDYYQEEFLCTYKNLDERVWTLPWVSE
jgi:hypothetical protein